MEDSFQKNSHNPINMGFSGWAFKQSWCFWGTNVILNLYLSNDRGHFLLSLRCLIFPFFLSVISVQGYGGDVTSLFIRIWAGSLLDYCLELAEHKLSCYLLPAYVYNVWHTHTHTYLPDTKCMTASVCWCTANYNFDRVTAQLTFIFIF